MNLISMILVTIIFLFSANYLQAQCQLSSFWSDEALMIEVYEQDGITSGYSQLSVADDGSYEIHINHFLQSTGHGGVTSSEVIYMTLQQIIKDSKEIFNIDEATINFNIIIEYPTCWVFDPIVEEHNPVFRKNQPCEETQCCRVDLTLQEIDGNIIVRAKSSYQSTYDCSPLFSPLFNVCTNVCSVIDLIEEHPFDPNDHAPCTESTALKYTTKDFNDIGGLTMEKYGNEVKVSPKFEIYESKGVKTFSLWDITQMDGDWTGFSENEITQFIIEYILKFMTNDDDETINIRIPCFTRNLGVMEPCDPPNCCEMTFTINKLGDDTYITDIIDNCVGNPTSPGGSDFSTTDPLLPNYGAENCEMECYWRVSGNSEIDELENFIGPTNGHDFIIKTGDLNENLLGERMRVTAEGNIGIGIAQPTSKFEILGDGKDGLTNIMDLKDSDNNSIFSILDNGDVEINGKLTNKDAQSQINFANLFIGTGTPDLNYNLNIIGDSKFTGDIRISDNLKVYGIVYTTEVIVKDPSTWPDFVFDKDYKLMSLSQISDYITKNGHLPGIPSKEKVSEEGVKLVEMQKLLLQKIEELTIHMIGLEKENNKLKTEVEILKNDK